MPSPVTRSCFSRTRDETVAQMAIPTPPPSWKAVLIRPPASDFAPVGTAETVEEYVAYEKPVTTASEAKIHT
jgi:hypothetical protein